MIQESREDRVYNELKEKIASEFSEKNLNLQELLTKTGGADNSYKILEILKNNHILDRCIVPDVFCNGMFGITFLWVGYYTNSSYIAINDLSFAEIKFLDDFEYKISIKMLHTRQDIFDKIIELHNFENYIVKRMFSK